MENLKDKKNDDILEKLVHINRITKVVKGGRRFGFSALVVVGNQSGKIGIAHAKAKQVPDAIKKANEMARRKLIHIPLREGRTIHHDVKAKDGSGKIVLRSASKGTGIIAGGPVRAVCEVLGVKDIVAKSMGTSNAHNVIRATMKALLKQNSPKQISTIRNKKISQIIEKRIQVMTDKSKFFNNIVSSSDWYEKINLAVSKCQKGAVLFGIGGDQLYRYKSNITHPLNDINLAIEKLCLNKSIIKCNPLMSKDLYQSWLLVDQKYKQNHCWQSQYMEDSGYPYQVDKYNK